MKVQVKFLYVTVYHPIAGWKAVLICRAPEGYEEPWETSPVAFETYDEAASWGRGWAKEEGVEFREGRRA